MSPEAKIKKANEVMASHYQSGFWFCYRAGATPWPFRDEWWIWRRLMKRHYEPLAKKLQGGL